MPSDAAVKIEVARRLYVAAIGTPHEAEARKYLKQQIDAARSREERVN